MGGIVDSIFGGGSKAIQSGMDNQMAMTSQAMQVQKESQEKALAAQQEYWDKALAEASQGRSESLAALLAGSQTSLDLGRQQAAQQMSWQLPQQAAAMSAMQALPQLQSALGLPAYALPKTVDTTLPPQVDLMGAYEAALQRTNAPNVAAAEQQKKIADIANTIANQVGNSQSSQTQRSPTVINPGGTYLSQSQPSPTDLVENLFRGGVSTWSQLEKDYIQHGGGPPPRPILAKNNPTAIASASSNSSSSGAAFDKDAFIKQLTDAMGGLTSQQQTAAPASVQSAITASPSTQFELKPEAVQFNMQASPLYDWQKQQATENINRALAARGIGGGAPATAVLGNAYTQLAAEERQRQVADLQNMVGMGMGISPNAPQGMGQAANAVSNFGGNLGNVLNQSSAQRQGLYSDIGSGLGNAYAAMGAGQGQGLLNMGQIQAAGANAMAQQPSALSQIAGLASLWGSGGMFGAGGAFGI